MFERGSGQKCGFFSRCHYNRGEEMPKSGRTFVIPDHLSHQRLRFSRIKLPNQGFTANRVTSIKTLLCSSICAAEMVQDEPNQAACCKFFAVGRAHYDATALRHVRPHRARSLTWFGLKWYKRACDFHVERFFALILVYLAHGHRTTKYRQLKLLTSRRELLPGR